MSLVVAVVCLLSRTKLSGCALTHAHTKAHPYTQKHTCVHLVADRQATRAAAVSAAAAPTTRLREACILERSLAQAANDPSSLEINLFPTSMLMVGRDDDPRERVGRSGRRRHIGGAVLGEL